MSNGVSDGVSECLILSNLHCCFYESLACYILLQNKNVFSYFTHLVQEGIFSKIEVYFLIVGHTHASIDQYFSVLASIIFNTAFIGSPLALASLLAREKNRTNLTGNSWMNKNYVEGDDSNSRPLLVRELSVVYNWRDTVKPLLDNSIVFFQVPHCFLFDKWNGRATMRYKLFSKNKIWLPKRPQLDAGM